MPRRLASEAAKLWKAVYHPSDRATIHVMNGCSRNKCASPLTGTDENGPYYDHYAWEIETQDLVVVPSMSFSFKELTTIDGFIHYEERSLYVLFALSTPGTRIIIVTSTPLDEWILEYHFSLLPLHHREAYKNRVHFYSVGDPSPNKCLTEKILAHPRLLDRLKRDEVGSKNHNRVLMVYRSTLHEDKLARALDMPYYAARPEQSVYGTKQGSRTIFRDLHIPCADGTYDEEKDLTSLMKSIWSVLRRNPGATKGLVKLADGFSGMGNATLDLGGIQQRLLQINSSIEDADEKLRALTLHALKTAAFHNRTWEEFSEELEVMRAIFELFIEYTSGERVGNESTITSPSVQVVVNEDGSVSVLSTHEQILDNQVYHGCEFPCRSDYRLQLMEYGRLIGEYLSRHDVRDRFGVDFLCVPRPNGRWDIYAVEINLRLTGTTHPWMTMKLLTHGYTDPNTGLFMTPSGRNKYYVSNDDVSDASLKQLVPQDLYELMAARKDLHWDPIRQSGVVFHMLGRMSEYGTTSMTAIANSSEGARQLFNETFDYIIQEAKRDL